jgi:hypothetical protein
MPGLFDIHVDVFKLRAQLEIAGSGLRSQLLQSVMDRVCLGLRQ